MDYLYNRVKQTADILPTDKQLNKGTVLLADSGVWRQRLNEWVQGARDQLFSSARKSNGTCKLTSLSAAIGAPIAYEIGLDDQDPRITVAIGDLFLEGFLQEGTVSIQRESKQYRSPYTVTLLAVTPMKLPLKGTSPNCPKDISSLRNTKGQSVIKRNFDSDSFKDHLATNPVWIKSLNKLRQTPWTLNKEVLAIVQAERDKFITHTIPLVDAKGTIFDLPVVGYNTNHLKGRWYFKDTGGVFLKEKDKRLAKLRSRNYEYQIILQKALAVPEVFYQEYTCDFRGRIYCSETFLEFQGSDLARGLFLFANQQAYTSQGIRALKVHIANSYDCSFTKGSIPTYFKEDYDSKLTEDQLETISLGKLTFGDKINWVNNNLSWIIGQNTIDLKAETPVAFLAACIELRNVLQDADYLGGLPIPVDGSCNGYQHQAAMSLDQVAAELVSLTPQKFQQDFYVAVAKEMIKLEPQWFANKQMPMKHIRKGISKRGSMTRAYSAGAARIAENMEKDCHIEGFDQLYGLTKADYHMLARTLVKAVNTVCAGPLRITKWLQALATHELDNKAQSISWTTPSGFPVTFTSYKDIDLKFKGTIAGVGQIHHVVKTIEYTKQRQSDGTWLISTTPVNDRKGYAKGISPNMVHSYDAAHLSLVMTNFDGDFAAVHDSFSSHGNLQEQLLSTIKQQFKLMYDNKNWFDAFKSEAVKHPGFTTLNPERGTYTFDQLDNADYFFC